MPLRRLLLPVVCITAMLLSEAVCFAATQDGPALEVSPSTIQMAAGDSAQVLLLVRNNSAATLQNVQLHPFSDLNLTVSPTEAIHSLKPHAVSVWPVKVTQGSAGRSVGKLNFWISYDGADGADSGAAVASLDIAERPALDVGKLVTLRLESAVDRFDEKHEAYFFLVVTNTSATPVTVKALHADSPGFIDIKTVPTGEISLAPGSSRSFTVTASAHDNAPTGTQRILLSADLAWFDAGHPQTATVSTAQTLPLSVLGESDLLKLIGVPSFLFLPGTLALVMFSALWSRTRKDDDWKLTLSLQETAVAGVTLSLIAAAIYPWFPPHRDYLVGYGIRDIFRVWMDSVFVGFLAWLALYLYTWYQRVQKAKQEEAEAQRLAAENETRMKERTPTKTDTPLEMLARLQILNRTPPTPQALVSLAGSAKATAFVFAAGSAATDSDAWVGPPIFLTPRAVTAAEWKRSKLIEKLSQDTVQQSYREMSLLLSQAEAAGWNVVWGESGSITGPTPVPATELQAIPARQGFELIQLP